MTSTQPSQTAANSGGTTILPSNSVWLVTRSALSALVGDPTVKAKLRRRRVYELLQPRQRPLGGFPSTRIVSFPSAAALKDSVAAGRVPAGTYGVLYDPEAWPLTPVAEQLHPVEAATEAAKAAHAHGLRLIVAPALDLIKVLDTGSTGPRWRRFLDLNLAGRMARVADVVELQAQSLERSTSTYAAFVRAATSQVKATGHATSVLAGLSTNPSGGAVNSGDLTAAIGAVGSLINGFWINIPRPGRNCPACGSPRPDIAIKVVQATS